MYAYQIRFSLLLACSLAIPAFGQDTLKPDLTGLSGSNTLARVYWEYPYLQNQNATPLDDGTHRGLHFDAQPGEGVLWIPNVELVDGVIEVDVRGDRFVGIAFHGANNATYEAIYLRPFNFLAEDPEQRARSVQYISLPDYTWNALREAHSGRYETGLDPAPDPKAWVHLRVVLTGPQARRTPLLTASHPRLPC